LFLGDSEKQPLIVAFGGGGGGNDWSRKYLKEKRDSLNKLGYAVLAIGYFKSYGTPKSLDRISLDAIHDTILSVAKHQKIDQSKIILMGGSKGGELILNLASKYDDFKAVITMSTSHVTFPALTWSANTSSWTYKDQELPYVPATFKTIFPALKGDLFAAHSIMLDDKVASKKAEIEVENIKASILLLSGKNDEQWPSTYMSDQIILRLKNHNYKHYYSHIALEGGHIAPLENFNLVYDFLEAKVKPEKY
jgi:dipeptidyl aminopeptidase/acylaminoacyl peptidase